MAASTRGRLRDVLTFVAVNPSFYYGWNAPDLDAALGITAADLSTELGHMDAVAANAVTAAVLVTGANSPKPNRVRKALPAAPLNETGSVSTFVAFDKTAAAAAGGWKLANRGHGVRLTASTAPARRITAIAELSNGAQYAFPMDKNDFGTYGPDLGLRSAEQMTTQLERRLLVTGSKTKPGRCSRSVGGGTFSSFYNTASLDTIVGLGYNIDSEELIEFA